MRWTMPSGDECRDVLSSGWLLSILVDPLGFGIAALDTNIVLGGSKLIALII